MMKNDDFKLLKGFASRRTDRLTDICECRVAFETESRNLKKWKKYDPNPLELNIFITLQYIIFYQYV